mgnify:CR=1 FL=1
MTTLTESEIARITSGTFDDPFSRLGLHEVAGKWVVRAYIPGADRIELSIAGRGSELIRISDNGCGMTAQQLPLALASHATSKITSGIPRAIK